jgi:hypothetical protein
MARTAQVCFDKSMKPTGGVAMKFHLLTWVRRLSLPLVVLALLVPHAVWAQESVTVQLQPVADSGVRGTATLTAADEGTNITLDLQGLAPGVTAQAALQAGTCEQPSASFVALPELQADASGRATATGAALFRGAEPVDLVTFADGAHVVTVQTEQLVACGVIPALTAAPAAPELLPTTGAAAPSFMAEYGWIVALGVLAVGFLLWSRNRP